MTRLSAKTRDELPDSLQPLWDKISDYGDFGNQAAVMAHRPPIFERTWQMLTELADQEVLSKRHLELAVVTVSLLNQCTYCISHHAPQLTVQGISEDGATRLSNMPSR